MYSIFHTVKFDKEISKYLSEKEREELFDIETKQLKENPYVGDPISYPFFREKRIRKGKRIYYLIYDEFKAVLMVNISDKKTQQDTINNIKFKLKEYYEVIKQTLKQHA